MHSFIIMQLVVYLVCLLSLLSLILSMEHLNSFSLFAYYQLPYAIIMIYINNL